MEVGETLLSRYQVIRALSTGGFGETYLARDVALPGQPPCVVKHLKPKDPNPEVFEIAKTLFEREAKALYRLGEYDGIPRLFANFEQEGEFYLVQEYIDGHDVTVELQPDRPWTEAQTVQLLRSLLRTLEVVHRQQVIHRDIKPQNIMRRHRDGRLMLIDFGAVKEISQLTVTDQGQTSITAAIGSPGYMPIEQAAGKPKPASDVYAVGMIAIQALTGLHPSQFAGDVHDSELLWRDRAHISDRLAEVLTTMVREKSTERYPTASHALAAFEEAIATQALPPSEAPTSLLFGERRSAPSGVRPTARAEDISNIVHHSVSPNTKRLLWSVGGFLVVTAVVVAGIGILESGSNEEAATPHTETLPTLPRDSDLKKALSKKEIPQHIRRTSREIQAALSKEESEPKRSSSIPDMRGIDDGVKKPVVTQNESALTAPMAKEHMSQEEVRLRDEQIYKNHIKKSLGLYVGRREKEGIKSSSGKQIYTYYLSVTLPMPFLREVQQVKYFFNHESFKTPIRESTDLLTSFRVSYIGWGCVHDVTVTLHLKSGVELQKPFDMCNNIYPPHTLNSISKAYQYDIFWCDYSAAESKHLAGEIYSTLKAQGVSGAKIRPYDEEFRRASVEKGYGGKISTEASIRYFGFEELQAAKDVAYLLFGSIGIPVFLEAVSPGSPTPGYLSIFVCP
jgi:serine/threonine protein kinase